MMITLLVTCYFFNALMVSMIHAAIDFKSKPIMCGYKGGLDPAAVIQTQTYDIPPKCEVIVFTLVTISGTNITCDTEVLKLLVANHSVLLVISRKYNEWVEALKPEGSAADAKAITDYVTANGCAGVLLEGTSPPSSPADTSTGENLLAYITHLKSKAGIYVGITLVQNYPNALADPKASNYEDLNKVLDFYLVNTFKLNEGCKFGIFNGATPINGTKDLVGMDSVVETLQNTTIAVDKSYLVEDLFTVDDKGEFSIRAYYRVCIQTEDTTAWCAPTTQDYIDKAKYIKDNKYGLCVKFIEYDDVMNNCGCGRFIGFQNIIAGYTGKAHIPCDRFDRKNPMLN